MPLVFRKQPSGGRGEYELVGAADNGVTASELAGSTFVWDTPFGQKDTHVRLTNQGGKRRLRIQNAAAPHIHRQGAALAMLPYPIRDEDRVSDAQPILLEERYILDIGVHLVSHVEGVSVVSPTTYTARSGPADDEAHRIELDAADRFARIQAIWSEMAELPEPVRLAVEAHRAHLELDDVIGVGAENVVKAIISSLSQVNAPLYVPGGDPLPALEILAGIRDEVDLPTPPEAPADSPEIRRRLESEYRQIKSRGASGRQFKLDVQAAYGYVCAFCGFRALDIPGLARSGVDAAHILPWGKFDLDVVTNGIQLCKLDHWAFDAHVLLLRHDDGEYGVELNPDFAALITDQATLDVLQRAVGPIADDRLPAIALRPNPDYIKTLYEGLDEENDT